MPLRLATLVSAQLLDLGTFVAMVAWRGPENEANPIVSNVLDSLGMPAVIAAKIALIVLVVCLAVAGTARGRRGVWAVVGGLPLAFAIVLGLIGGISNAAVILG